MQPAVQRPHAMRPLMSKVSPKLDNKLLHQHLLHSNRNTNVCNTNVIATNNDLYCPSQMVRCSLHHECMAV
jgi:hypothetical protein